MTSAYIMKKVLESMDKGEDIATVTITGTKGSTPRGVGAMMAVLTDGSIYGSIGGGILEKHTIDQALEALKTGESRSLSLSLDQDELKMICGGEVDLFINVHRTKPKLLIAGGGHIGYAIYRVASLLDFDVVIFEDREELLDRDRFEYAHDLVSGRIDERLAAYPIDSNSYIVVVTRGHEYDQASLEAVIDSGAKYIGVMGSKSKVKTMMCRLKEKGIQDDQLENVYSPIGLKICNGTPEEIAISIMAEILTIKNNGDLRHMRI